MKHYPYFISHEYEKLEGLCTAGLYTGAAMELKDLFEIILKLPVLTGMAYIIQSGDREGSKACLKLLMRKPPSLGDWKLLADLVTAQLPARSVYAAPLHSILENVTDLYNDSKAGIIKWRNDLFGHGAFVDNDFYRQQVEEKRPYLDAYLAANAQAYSCLHYYIKGMPVEEMQGMSEDMAFDAQAEMTIAITAGEKGKEKIFSVAPFIRQLFFYDSLNIHSMLVYGLNYLSGRKVSYASDFLVDQYFEAIRKPNEKPPVSPFQTQETDTALNELNAIADLVGTKGYTPMDNLEGWFDRCLEEEKGVFLLQMERGMGKTGFASHLDPLFGQTAYEDLFMRCYYCSRMEYRSAMDFANSIYQMWFIREEGGQLQVKDAEIHSLRNDTAHPAQDMCRLLEDICYFGEQTYGKEKLVLWIDGIDELKTEYMHRMQGPNAPLTKALGNTLLDFIPDPEDLPDNVYIFLTCRTDEEEFPAETKRWLRQFPFSERQTVTRQSPAHLENLRCFVREKTRKRLDLSPEQIDEIIRIADSSYLNIKLMLPALVSGRDLKDFDALTAEKIVTTYLTQLRDSCGKKQRRYLSHILALFAFAREPLSVEQIAYLLEGRIGFRVELIVALKQLSGLISANRDPSGRKIRFTVSNIAFKEILKERYRDLNRNLVNEWIDNILAVKESAYFICKRDDDLDNYNYVFNDGSLYLYSNILDYAEETGNRKVWSQAFADRLMQYENHLSGKAHGAYGISCDIAISGEVIHILEALGAAGEPVDPETLSIAYNNRVYHVAFTLYDHENAIPDLQKSIEYLEKVPEDKRDTRYRARSARIYNNMADLLRAVGSSYEAVNPYREKSGSIRRRLMSETFSDYAEDYTMYLLGKAEDALVGGRADALIACRDEAAEIYQIICTDYADQCDMGILNPRAGSRQEYGYEFQHIGMEMLYAAYIVRHPDENAGDASEAAAIYRQAATDLEKLMKGSKVIQLTIALATVRAAYELAGIYERAGRSREAEKLLRDKLTWIRTIYLNNPDYLNAPVAEYLEKLKGYLKDNAADDRLGLQIEEIYKRSRKPRKR